MSPPSDELHASRPAWLPGNDTEFRTLSLLQQQMHARERQRRQTLIGRSLITLILVAAGVGCANGLVMAADGTNYHGGMFPLCTVVIVAGPLVLFEFLRFVENHLSGMHLHAEFATHANAVVARGGLPDSVSPGSASAALHAQLRAFVIARRKGKLLMPSLLNAGFTARPRSLRPNPPPAASSPKSR